MDSCELNIFEVQGQKLNTSCVCWSVSLQKVYRVLSTIGASVKGLFWHFVEQSVKFCLRK